MAAKPAAPTTAPAASGQKTVIKFATMTAQTFPYAELNAPHTEIIRHLPGPSGTLRDGRGAIGDRIVFDLRPFIGTIGTAAEWEIESTVAGQGPWGGNLDVRDFKAGSRLQLPVLHEGRCCSWATSTRPRAIPSSTPRPTRPEPR